MTTPDECRQYADECVRWAARAKTQDERQAFLDMASAWTQAALRFAGGAASDATAMMTSPPAQHERASARDTARFKSRPLQ
jgi:hypothetical protein